MMQRALKFSEHVYVVGFSYSDVLQKRMSGPARWASSWDRSSETLKASADLNTQKVWKNAF